MSVRVNCPHCRTACLVAEQHLGVPVQCGRCRRIFTTRADAPPLVRLDLGAAASPDTESNFLVQRLSWCNLDKRHEWAILAIANGLNSTAMASLCNKVLNGTAKDAASVSEAISAALPGADVVVVIGDGQVHIRQTGEGRVYHQRAGRLATAASPLKLAAGDWLLVVRAGPDAATLQAALAPTSSSAAELAQQLIERAAPLGGRENCMILAVRCY